MKAKDIALLLAFVLVSLLAGVIGSVFTAPSIPTWYAALSKPFFNPPNWIFAPVWTTLYILMGIAAYLVFKAGFERREVKVALGVFGTQLAINALWSYLFFGLHWLLISFLEVMLLWVLILQTMVLFNRLSRPAGLMIFPYLLWVTFASLLNFSIWLLNI